MEEIDEETKNLYARHFMCAAKRVLNDEIYDYLCAYAVSLFNTENPFETIAYFESDIEDIVNSSELEGFKDENIRD